MAHDQAVSKRVRYLLVASGSHFNVRGSPQPGSGSDPAR